MPEIESKNLLHIGIARREFDSYISAYIKDIDVVAKDPQKKATLVEQLLATLENSKKRTYDFFSQNEIAAIASDLIDEKARQKSIRQIEEKQEPDLMKIARILRQYIFQNRFEVMAADLNKTNVRLDLVEAIMRILEREPFYAGIAHQSSLPEYISSELRARQKMLKEEKEKTNRDPLFDIKIRIYRKLRKIEEKLPNSRIENYTNNFEGVQTLRETLIEDLLKQLQGSKPEIMAALPESQWIKFIDEAIKTYPDYRQEMFGV